MMGNVLHGNAHQVRRNLRGIVLHVPKVHTNRKSAILRLVLSVEFVALLNPEVVAVSVTQECVLIVQSAPPGLLSVRIVETTRTQCVLILVAVKVWRNS